MWRVCCAAPSPKGRNVNKAQLIDAVSDKLESSRRAAGEAVDAVLTGIIGAVVSGDKVSLTGFGTFESAKRPARTARNPRTGESVRVAAATVPKFRAGQAFKDEVNAAGGAKRTAKKGAAKRPAGKAAAAKSTAAKRTAATKTTSRAAAPTRGAAKAPASKTAAAPAPNAVPGKKTAASAAAKKSAAKRAAARPAAKKSVTTAPATKNAAKKATAKSTSGKKTAAKKR